MAKSLRQIFTLALICALSPIALANTVTTPKVSANYAVDGRVKVEGLAAKLPLTKTSKIKLVLDGGLQVTFIRPDAGTHLLEVVAMGYYFSPVRVDISARLQGQVRAVAVETRKTLPDGLVLEPLREEFYYEEVDVRLWNRGILACYVQSNPPSLTVDYNLQLLILLSMTKQRREPFSVAGLLKSPMGLMVGFMLVAVFLLPKLMENIDPEEMKRVQEDMRNQPTPSFSNLLQGRS